MSWGMAVNPARRMTVAKGSNRQVWTVMMEIIAKSGCPSQMGQVWGPKMPTARRLQLMML